MEVVLVQVPQSWIILRAVLEKFLARILNISRMQKHVRIEYIYHPKLVHRHQIREAVEVVLLLPVEETITKVELYHIGVSAHVRDIVSRSIGSIWNTLIRLTHNVAFL